MIKRLYIISFCFLFALFFLPGYIFADSSYVLPYPSFMPGNSLYRIHTIFEELLQYWYFGSFGRFEYALRESDRYLVEAKTLFEYKQYLFGEEALKQSDAYFQEIPLSLLSAQHEGKDISQKRLLAILAAEKHKEVLEGMQQIVPPVVKWHPEKSAAQTLSLKKSLDESILIRNEPI